MFKISSPLLKNSHVDLAPEHMQFVVATLKKFVSHERVAVFGSRVHGTTKPTSDLDLVILNTSPLPHGVLSTLQLAFSESTLPMKVDIVEWATTSENFQKIIEERNVRIW